MGGRPGQIRVMWFSDWAIRLMVVAVALIGLLQVGPVILSSRDIGDNYYDAPPPVVREQTTWLGLFI